MRRMLAVPSHASSQRRGPAYVARALLLVAVVGVANPAPVEAGWSERGPALGGRLSAIVATGQTLIVGSPGGGVWRRTPTTGPAWVAAKNVGLTDYSVTHLEWDVVTPGRLYAVTWNGLYASTNNGDSWTGLINPGGTPAPIRPDQNLPNDPKPFAQLKFSPTERAVFASPPCSGLFYSFDGVNFTQYWPFAGGPTNVNNCIGTIAADPVSKRVYFSTMYWKHFDIPRVYRSNCDPLTWGPGTPCLQWEPANTGLPQSLGIAAMTSVATPGSEYRLMAAVKTMSGDTSFYARSDGSQWKGQTSFGAASWDPRALVYAGSGKEMFHGNVWSVHTLDFVNWYPFKLSGQHADTRGIYFDQVAKKVWTVTDGAGPDGKLANITRWDWIPGSKPTNGVNLGHGRLRVWQAYYAGVVATQNPNKPRRVFLGSMDNHAICSDTLGASWTHKGAPPTGGVGDLFAIQFAPSNPNRAYARSASGSAFMRTTNAGSALTCADVVWEEITFPNQSELNPPRYWSRNTIAIHPTDPEQLYLALLKDVAVIKNAGGPSPTVTHLTIPVTTPGDPPIQPTAVYVDSGGTIYVGTAGHGAYKYDGQSWTEWGLNTNPPAIVTAITRSGGPNPTFWMATSNLLYKGTATGGPWTVSAGGSGWIVSDVAVDPSCPTRVYAAFGFGGWRAQHPGGIAVTSNNGGQWKSITTWSALNQVPITDVEVDPTKPKQVYAASYGRGFWVYDWGPDLPACQP